MLNEKFANCVEACHKCVEACEECEDSCIEEKDVKKMLDCIRTDRDCAIICNMTATLLMTNSRFAEQICKLCSEVCESCAEECEKFFDMEHCAKCAEACRACAHECDMMVKSHAL